MRGPCIVCGTVGYAMSMGGPGICPSCDCGNFGMPMVQRQGNDIVQLRSELSQARARIAELESDDSAFRDAAEKCGMRRNAKASEIAQAFEDNWADLLRIHKEKCRYWLALKLIADDPLSDAQLRARAALSSEDKEETR